MLDLALHIVDTKKGTFKPDKFEDHYEDALKELIRKKQKGERIERPKEPARSNVINLMDALRQSVKAESGTERKKGARLHAARAAPKRRANTRHRKAS